MRKNEKVMRFRSGEQVGQRFLVVSNPLFCSFKFVNAQQTSASFSWPVFSLVTGPSGRSARQTEI